MLWIVAQFGVCRSLKHDKVLCDEQKKTNEQRKNRESVLYAETAYSSQNTEFGLIM